MILKISNCSLLFAGFNRIREMPNGYKIEKRKGGNGHVSAVFCIMGHFQRPDHTGDLPVWNCDSGHHARLYL
jgi:hypothetical protein